MGGFYELSHRQSKKGNRVTVSVTIFWCLNELECSHSPQLIGRFSSLSWCRKCRSQFWGTRIYIDVEGDQLLRTLHSDSPEIEDAKKLELGPENSTGVRCSLCRLTLAPCLAAHRVPKTCQK